MPRMNLQLIFIKGEFSRKVPALQPSVTCPNAKQLAANIDKFLKQQRSGFGFGQNIFVELLIESELLFVIESPGFELLVEGD